MHEVLASVRNLLSKRVAPLLLRELMAKLSPLAGTVYRLRRKILISRLYLSRVLVGKRFKQTVQGKNLSEEPIGVAGDCPSARWLPEYISEESDIPAPSSDEHQPDSDPTTGGMQPRTAADSLPRRTETFPAETKSLKPQEKKKTKTSRRPNSNFGR
jgi:hypothetical protein